MTKALASVAWPHRSTSVVGSEPAQPVAVLPFRHEEGGFGQIVLGGQILEHPVGQPCIERHDRRRIAAEDDVGESIHLINALTHDASYPLIYPARLVKSKQLGCRSSPTFS